MKNRTIPNFLIIGAGKSGTSSLHEYLKQHPEIFMSPVKEPMYFRYGYGTEKLKHDEKSYVKVLYDTKDKYLQLFKDVENEKIVGESSVTYLANPVSAQRIKDFNPNMKLLAVLRNPVERAFSFYKMSVRMGLEKKSFKRAVNEELVGKRENDIQLRRYLFMSKSYDSIRVYNNHFDEKKFKIFLYEDLKKKDSFFKELFDFLEVDNSIKINTDIKHNISSQVPYHPFFRSLYSMLRKHPTIYPDFLKKQYLPELSMELRSFLVDYFREDTKSLQGLIWRDLKHWMY